MSEKLTVQVFRVSPINHSAPLEHLLEEIHARELPDRLRLIRGVEYRLEDLHQDETGLWFLDFGKFRRVHGPGAASQNTAVRGFEFQDGEVFCEETAMLYDPGSRYAVIQYNHYGARPGSIQEYFNSFVDGEPYTYELRPKYDEDAERRFEQSTATRRLTFAIDGRLFSNQDYEAGTPLAQAIELARRTDGVRLELTVSVGSYRNRSLRPNVIRNMIAALLRKHEDMPDAVSRVEVGMLTDQDARMEVVDLIAQRLTHTFEGLPLGDDLRIPRDSRYDALRRAYNMWRRRLGHE